MKSHTLVILTRADRGNCRDTGCDPQTNGWACTEFAARIWFMIYAIRNLFKDYILKVEAVQQGQINFGMTSDWLMGNFVSHDFKLAVRGIDFKAVDESGMLTLLGLNI